MRCGHFDAKTIINEFLAHRFFPCPQPTAPLAHRSFPRPHPTAPFPALNPPRPEMRRLRPPPLKRRRLIQISSAEEDRDERNGPGHCMGASQLRTYLRACGSSMTHASILSDVAAAYAAMHVKADLDAYDVEFLLASTSEEGFRGCGLDFDNVSHVEPGNAFPYCLRRKIAEGSFVSHRVTSLSHLYRFLASAPSPALHHSPPALHDSVAPPPTTHPPRLRRPPPALHDSVVRPLTSTLCRHLRQPGLQGLEDIAFLDARRLLALLLPVALTAACHEADDHWSLPGRVRRREYGDGPRRRRSVRLFGDPAFRGHLRLFAAPVPPGRR